MRSVNYLFEIAAQHYSRKVRLCDVNNKENGVTSFSEVKRREVTIPVNF
jgi:uncharacterized protein YxeA